MKKHWLVSLKILLALFTLVLSVFIAQWIAEKFFFDNFFYYKSVKHGYWVQQKDKFLILEDFGDRAQDTIALHDFIKNPNQENVLGLTNDRDIFTVAIIGDSFVWGQGLRDKDRFVNILKDKLNKVRKTEIISLGGSGDSMLDNYIKYLYITKFKSVDLTIFGMVSNDLFLREKSLYDDKIQRQMIEACNKPIIIDTPDTPPEELTMKAHQSYLNDFGNICVFENALSQIPRTNVIFFDFGPFGWQELMEKYKDSIRKFGFKMITAILDWSPSLNVSKKDPHPSAYSNRIFADVLYEEIIKNEY